MTDTAASYCFDQVRRQDRDRYLTALFAPEPARDRLMALYAFNLELARTREVVSEPMLGQIRLQWWREALEELQAGTQRRHEVVQALAAADGLDHGLLARMIDARVSDLEDVPFATLEDLRRYVADTAGALNRQAARLLTGGDAAVEAAVEAVAGDIGIAYGLAGLIRAVPFHARQHRISLPAELLSRHGVRQQALYDMRAPASLAGALEELATMADEHLERARQARRQVPKAALPALLPAVLAERELRRLRQGGFAVFAPVDPAAGALAKPLRLTLAAFLRRY